MDIQHNICPHCGSGDVEAFIPPRHDDLFVGVPTAQRHCLVCGVRWELDDLDLGADEQRFA